jgi:hypothetical protein
MGTERTPELCGRCGMAIELPPGESARRCTRCARTVCPACSDDRHGLCLSCVEAAPPEEAGEKAAEAGEAAARTKRANNVIGMCGLACAVIATAVYWAIYHPGMSDPSGFPLTDPVMGCFAVAAGGAIVGGAIATGLVAIVMARRRAAE